MKECYICGSTDRVEEHHIVHGRGKRKTCETPYSQRFLCWEHHRGTKGVHGKNGHELDMRLHLELQAQYFKMGATEEAVRWLMGGKLYLRGDEIYGYTNDNTVTTNNKKESSTDI